VISHEWGNDWEVFTYPWSFVTQIFLDIQILIIPLVSSNSSHYSVFISTMWC
jgi:hypothetical protein